MVTEHGEQAIYGDDPRLVRVKAYPTDPSLDHWLVECNKCGTIALSGAESETDDLCVAHLKAHGVDVSAWEAAYPQSTEDDDPDEVPD